MKINDRILLGLIAGLGGNLVKTAIDEASLSLKLSQRSFRSTAAGVWVKRKRDAESVHGQVLGGLIDFGMSAVGGIGTVYLLSKTGRDQLLAKGLVSGITIGSTVTGMLSVFPTNKVQPKDAISNLSYMASHAVLGLVTTAIVAKLGDDSLFDAKPYNDYVSPTAKTTEEQRISETRKRNILKHRVSEIPQEQYIQ